jgi:glycosyltransferase involved in cell wall biosynthesis
VDRVDVTHVSPNGFGESGVWGGGERYPLSLALAMSRCVPTRLLVFGRRQARRRLGALEICELPTRTVWKGGSVNPVSERLALFVPLTRRLHVHQYHSVVTNLVLLAGAAAGREVFVTDHGGASFNYADRFSLQRFLTGFLPVSRFSASLLPQLADRACPPIYGGAEPHRFHPGAVPRSRQIVYVGRLLPHKGIDVLLEAVDRHTPLRVFGRSYDPEYRAHLHRLSEGKDVVFRESASDEEIAFAYRTSRVAVLPSVYRSRDGAVHPWPELLGLTLLEAMASGTPVVASNVGGIPEIVDDGETGFIFEPGQVAELRERIYQLLDDSSTWQAMSNNAVEAARTRFTWDHVAQRSLAAYSR